METKKSFLLYIDTYSAIKDLPVEEKAQLLDAIFQYHINPENPVGSLGSGARMAFNFLLLHFKRDNEKYLKKVEANRKNGHKGGRPKTQWVISKPKKPDSDSDSDRDIKNKDFSSTIQDKDIDAAITPEIISSIADKHNVSEKDVKNVVLPNLLSRVKRGYKVKDWAESLDIFTHKALHEFKYIKQKKSLEEFLEEETGNPVT